MEMLLPLAAWRLLLLAAVSKKSNGSCEAEVLRGGACVWLRDVIGGGGAIVRRAVEADGGGGKCDCQRPDDCDCERPIDCDDVEATDGVSNSLKSNGSRAALPLYDGENVEDAVGAALRLKEGAALEVDDSDDIGCGGRS